MAYIPNSGSVVAFQSNPANLQASITGVVDVRSIPSIYGNISGSVAAIVTNFPTTQNVSGSVIAQLSSSNASVITVGSPVANQSVSGTVNIGNLPTTQNVSGSVVATQGTNPWIITGSVQGSFSAGNSSVQVLNFPTNQSVSGTVGASIIGGVPVSIMGGLIGISGVPQVQGDVADAGVDAGNPVKIGGIYNASTITLLDLQRGNAQLDVNGNLKVRVQGNPSISGTVQVGNFPTTQNISGSVVAFGFPTNQNVSGSVVSFQGTSPWLTVPTSGSVIANQGGTRITSLVSTVPSSVIVGTSIFGQLPAGSAPLGSVATLQGTNPWIVNASNSSIINVHIGSIITVERANSIAGTYLEDAGHTTGDRGLFVLGVRNDNMVSVTSANLDYSAMAQGPVGETIVANSPITKWVQGTTSVLNQFGTSMITIAAQGASIFTYITGIQVANMSGSSVLVTFSGATSSVVGYTIAPPGGGSNIVYRNPLKTNANGAFTTSVSGVSSVYVSAQGFISQT